MQTMVKMSKEVESQVNKLKKDKKSQHNEAIGVNQQAILTKALANKHNKHDVKIAIPPNLAVGWLCLLLASGFSSKPK